jgi:hypothetical protein
MIRRYDRYFVHRIQLRCLTEEDQFISIMHQTHLRHGENPTVYCEENYIALVVITVLGFARKFVSQVNDCKYSIKISRPGI